MASKTSKPAASGADRPRNSSCWQADASEIARTLPVDQVKIPPRAVLARRWPALKINRLSWRWCDDRTGARGADRESLLEFLAKGA